MMLNKSDKIHCSNSRFEKVNTQPIASDRVLLQGVSESFVDGVLILTEQGEWVYANTQACEICEQPKPDQSQPNSVPKEIWHICQALIESRSLYPEQAVIIQSESTSEKLTNFRIRARWLKLKSVPHPCILVIVEDQDCALKNLAIAEVEQYGLTPREAEVWLRRRANYTRKEIADELYISLNTVNKHMKNIHAKRETVLHMEEWQSRLPLNRKHCLF